MTQDLSAFSLPKGFRGKNAITVQLWWCVQATLFRWSPQFAYGFRACLLRVFGAHIGKKTVIRPTVHVTYPWKVRIGNYSWIGDNAELYSLGEIYIGDNVVVSQRSYICTGDHDYSLNNFPIRARKVIVEDEVWVATDVFIAPGVTIGSGSVIGARSSVFSDMPAEMICIGTPCRPVRRRIVEG